MPLVNVFMVLNDAGTYCSHMSYSIGLPYRSFEMDFSWARPVLLWFVVPGAPEGSTGRLIFVVFGEACDPWFTMQLT